MEYQDINNQKVPDFKATEINSVNFGDSFRTFGSILIRNLIDKKIIDEIRFNAENAYEKADELSKKGRYLGTQFKDFGHLEAKSGGIENGKTQIYNMFCNSRIPSLYKELLGERIMILTRNSLPRRQHPHKYNPPTPFHQDASFLGDPGLIINSWIPLNEAGSDAPGIQVVLRPENKIHNESNFKVKTPTTYEEIDISRNTYFSEITPNLLWAPIMTPGDVLFFSHLTIHRTYLTDSMKLPRISLEIRCISA